MKRLIFWILFLGLAAGFLVYYWQTRDPLRTTPYLLTQWTEYNIRLLGHPQPRIAREAWIELWNLYFTKWQVYGALPKYLGNSEPISFLVIRQHFPPGGENAPAMDGFFADDKPIYYKAGQVYCRTVGEALMAIIYREKKWKVDYQGDWSAWWEANRKYY